MKLFLPLPGLSSKKLNIFHLLQGGSKLLFKIGNGMIQIGNGIISPSSAYDQKTSFAKGFSYGPRGSKISFKTGNEIIQTGNGIVSPTSRPLIKYLLLQNIPSSVPVD